MDMKKFIILTTVAALAIAVEEPQETQEREGKTLLGTFPFNVQAQDQAHHAHHDHHDHHDHHAVQPAREERQGSGGPAELDLATIANAGERCIQKIVMTEETEYEDLITCKHSYSKECHTTYATDYEPSQEEECSESFTKKCHIDYKAIASDETVKICRTPFSCTGPGKPEPKTVYETICSTTYHVHDVVDDVPNCQTIQDKKCEAVTKGYTTEQVCHTWPVVKCSPTTQRVKKTSPQTWCEKKPVTINVPGGCEPVPQPEECHDETQTIVQDVPKEECTLEPQKICKFVTKLVPHLKPIEECVDVPKEVCSKSRTNPKIVKKPVVKKWCYIPTAESGLLPISG